ncbi:hypothetical protein M6D81_24440 [Paenibacillus sp. J5C_2022]|uniref:hypothetical protein n=1 Tax=Paenibacillus sp. J5C2022 TaxID=2977129 RepID=UPI0021D1FFB5|nr:hypothetical protein [Paenibacillus sp. J5C2022]MCU6711854.1 hypothetical protein [Paenibacillus sp. J5C2022]
MKRIKTAHEKMQAARYEQTTMMQINADSRRAGSSLTIAIEIEERGEADDDEQRKGDRN